MGSRWAGVLLLGCAVVAQEPLHVARIERSGPPPYGDGPRVYRLEGSGCLALRVGEHVSLMRRDSRPSLGLFRVEAVRDGFALAVQDPPGSDFPLKGDLVVRHELLLKLPEPPEESEPLPPRETLEVFQTRVSAPPLPPPPPPPPDLLHRAPIFFLAESDALTPGAQAKLQGWVAQWGKEGDWVLLCPPPGRASDSLQESRVHKLKAQLLLLGATSISVKTLPPEPAGRYDAIYVAKTTR